ncbi:MAG: 2-oxoglutarate and iron-dependent oxygenase domain-containing protein [Acidimicrobiales bacterium]
MSSTVTTTAPAIPVLDLRRWDADTTERAALAAEMGRVCHEVGFFYAEGHGVDDAFLERYFGALQAFFALPEEVKARIDKRHSPHFRGWERIGAELTNNRPDHREQLDVSTENPPYERGADPAFLHLAGPNQWLPEDVLPGFRELVGEYFRRMDALARRIMSIMAVGLELPAGTFDALFGERTHSLAKLISYPPTPPGEAGVNGHHDAGFLTVLAQFGVGGLQALLPDGNWADVAPRPGAFVINTGEMLQELTGNYVVAATHRVITGEPRFSAAYFHGPDLRTELTPLPLAERFRAAVAASPRHANAGFMARRNELEAGVEGIASRQGAGVYGQQLWNYYCRSYPDNVAAHYPELV